MLTGQLIFWHRASPLADDPRHIYAVVGVVAAPQSWAPWDEAVQYLVIGETPDTLVIRRDLTVTLPRDAMALRADQLLTAPLWRV